mmetsp:Transcript_49145/g.117142  ORF Transcript_49145/g.117142 Transcript_49145/m.117142 type:complete len:84 (+) Transcript_49145:198-449(+)
MQRRLEQRKFGPKQQSKLRGQDLRASGVPLPNVPGDSHAPQGRPGDEVVIVSRGNNICQAGFSPPVSRHAQLADLVLAGVVFA